MATTAEEMAIAVLRGDEAAAAALADYLLERRDGRPLAPVCTVKVPVDRLRVVLFIADDAEVIDREAIDAAVRRWLYSNQPLILLGVTRIELYELPPISLAERLEGLTLTEPFGPGV